MKKILLMLMLMVLNVPLTFSQNLPYALSPKWMLGQSGGIDFTSGSPVVLSGNVLNTEEMTGTICSPNKNIALYSNNFRLVSGANVIYGTNPSGSTSSTNGPVIVPNPASPTNQYYLFTGNAEVTGSGGGAGGQGITSYLVTTSGTTITSMVAQTPLAGNTVNEALTSGIGDNGSYWIVSHSRTTTAYNAWRVTSSGISSVVTSNGTVSGGGSWQSSIKISKCQDRIAMVTAGGNVEVYTWNKSTGQVGTLLRQLSGYTFLYGCEFSPDGNILYFTSLTGNMLYQLDIASGTVYSGAWGSSNDDPSMGTLQLGLDDKVYVCNVDWFVSPVSYIGVVNNPNVAGAGCNYDKTGFVLNSGSGWYPITYRGFANIARLQPNLPVISSTLGATCRDYNFSYIFQTYFLDNINVVPNSEVWNFGDGTGDLTGLGSTPSHTFPTGGTYTVTVTVTDATCNHTFTNTTILNVSCPLPVELISFTGIRYVDNVKLLWVTESEKNNDRFVIERSSDGIYFTPIGVVNGNGTSTSVKNWNYYDYYPFTGINYYRLVQYDFDGTKSYSNIISVNYVLDSKVIVYPNPFNNEITIQYLGEGSNIKIEVYDVVGKKIKEFTNDSNIITFGSDLSSGCYMLKVFDNDMYSAIKIIKK